MKLKSALLVSGILAIASSMADYYEFLGYAIGVVFVVIVFVVVLLIAIFMRNKQPGTWDPELAQKR